MNGALYLADLTGGQKTGLFYDQRENQAFGGNAYQDMHRVWRSRDDVPTLRMAAYLIALQRVAVSYSAMGL